jgi:RNA recognition motif-containing protein
MTDVQAQTTNDVAAATPAATVDDTNKVFAGNLAFATSEDQLKEVFSEVGNVTHVQIIHRGTRSLGYGFVTYATEAEAQKAVSTLDKRELAGREINVESAKPQLMSKHGDSGEDGEGKDGARGTGARGGRNARRSRNTRRGAAASRRPRADEGEEGGEEEAAVSGQENGEKAARKPKKANGASTAAATPRKPKGPPEGEPSKTLLFVANLPFQFTDEQLQAAFEGFQISSAKVIKRRFGTRTKGFGFVDLANEEEQQRALKEIQGKTVEGRALSLKVAIQGQDRAADDANEGEAAAAAPTA